MNNAVIGADRRAAINKGEDRRSAGAIPKETCFLSLKNMLQVSEDPKAGAPQTAAPHFSALHREAFRLEPSYWEWNMTTTNTNLYRSRRR